MIRNSDAVIDSKSKRTAASADGSGAAAIGELPTYDAASPDPAETPDETGNPAQNKERIKQV